MELTSSELQIFLSLSEELLCVADSGGRLTQVSPAWTRLLGWSEQELLSRPYLELIHPQDLEKLRLPGFEIRVLRKDGSYRSIRWNIQVDHARKTILAAGKDVTDERKQQAQVAEYEARAAHERLSEREALFKSLFDGSPVGIILLDEDRRYLRANSAYQKLLGYDENELFGKVAFDFSPSGQNALEKRKLVTRDGRVIWIKLTSAPIRINQNEKPILMTVVEDITQAQDQSDLLAEKTRLLEDVSRNVPGMIHTLERRNDGTFHSIYASEGSLELYGYTPEEFLKRDLLFLLIMHPDDRASFFEEIDRTEAGSPIGKWTGRFNLPGGKTKWVMIIFHINREAGDRVIWNAIHIDVDEAKRNEVKLRQFEKILESTSDLVACMGLNGTFLFKNQAWKDHFSFLDSGKTSLTQVHPKTAVGRLVNEAIPTAVNKGTWQGESSIVDKDGQETPVSQVILFHRDRHGKGEYISTFLRDITEVKNYEAELKSSRAFMAAILENSPSVIFVSDRQGKLIHVNAAFESLYDVNREDVLGHTLYHFHPKESVDKLIGRDSQLIDTGKPLITEEILPVKNQPRNFVTARFPIFNESGEISAIGAILTDVTEQREVKQLIQASKMSSLGEMAGGIAHEINNPLAIIIAKAGILKRGAQNGTVSAERLVSDLQKIEDTGNRIAKIVKGLRTFSRNADQDPFVESGLGTVIEDSLELCRERFKHQGIELKLEIPGNPIIQCRPTQISQVLINLLNNAYDAVSLLPDKWIHLSVTEKENGVVISATDSGSGIPEKVAARIMEPFFTTKELGSGTGLGLSISKGIIDAHHGRFYYDSASSNTRFVIELPFQQPKENKSAA